MQKTAHKITALLLCGLLIYNSLGYFMVLSVMRLAIQHQQWSEISTIPQNKLTEIIFEKKLLNKRITIVNSHEIRVDGKLYDVARKVDDGLQIIYYCLADSKEQNLISKTRLANSNLFPVPAKNTARLIIEKIIKSGIFEMQSIHFESDPNYYFPALPSFAVAGPVLSILHPPPQI